MAVSSTPSVLLLDLAGVLYNWAPGDGLSIPPKILKKMVNSVDWFEYEQGSIDRDVLFPKLSERFSHPLDDIKAAFIEAEKSVQLNQEFMDEVQRLKRTKNLRLVAMSNISEHDFGVLEKKLDLRSYFELCFLSGKEGMRKPSLTFFRRVLDAINAKPEQVVFVDDTLENIDAASAMGMQSIRFKSNADTIARLRLIFEDSVGRGKAWLEKNAKSLVTTTSDNKLAFLDNWSQMLILEATGNKDLVTYDEPPASSWNFFSRRVQPALISESNPKYLSAEAVLAHTSAKEYPDDLDTTAAVIETLPLDSKDVHAVLDDMLRYKSEDGRTLLYFDDSRPRFCPTVASNVLTAYAQNDRLSDVLPTLEFVHGYLTHRAYVNGTLYYIQGDPFLFFAARLLHRVPPSSTSPKLYQELPALLKERLRERAGLGGDSINLALRTTACQWLGVENKADLDALMLLQQADGGWGSGELYRTPTSGMVWGHRGLSTALAVQAIEFARGKAGEKGVVNGVSVPCDTKAGNWMSGASSPKAFENAKEADGVQGGVNGTNDIQARDKRSSSISALLRSARRLFAR